MTAAKKSATPPLDSESRLVGTLTKKQWERARAKSDAVHVVQHEVHAAGVVA